MHKLPFVPDLRKPIDTWCQHCKPGHGCSIYADRPQGCRNYICGWLISPYLGDEWFPAHCKFIIVATELPSFAGEAVRLPGGGGLKRTMSVAVDPAYPNAWRREPYYSNFKAWARHMQVQVRVGLHLIDILADGTERERIESRTFIESDGAIRPEDGVLKNADAAPWVEVRS
jgi:hypothetical protein